MQGWKYFGITKEDSTFFNARYEIWIQDAYHIKLEIVHTESKCSVFIWYNQDWRRPLELDRLDEIHSQPSVDLTFSSYVVLEPARYGTE